MDEHTDNISISKLNITAVNCSIIDEENLEIIIWPNGSIAVMKCKVGQRYLIKS